MGSSQNNQNLNNNEDNLINNEDDLNENQNIEEDEDIVV
jgi:hypothetical protein